MYEVIKSDGFNQLRYSYFLYCYVTKFQASWTNFFYFKFNFRNFQITLKVSLNLKVYLFMHYLFLSFNNILHILKLFSCLRCVLWLYNKNFYFLFRKCSYENFLNLPPGIINALKSIDCTSFLHSSLILAIFLITINKRRFYGVPLNFISFLHLCICHFLVHFARNF